MSRLLACVVVCALQTGCSLHTQLAAMVEQGHARQTDLDEAHQAFDQLTSDDGLRRRQQKVDRPWIIGKALPLAREVTLPTALRADVRTTLLFSDGPLELPDIAQRISRATGIPVHVHPEAMLPADAFMPRLASGGAIASHGAPARMVLAGQSEPLASILDRIAATLSVRWAYRSERIEFFRTETRVFNIRALTLEARADASLGLRGDNLSDGSFASSSQTRLESMSGDVFSVVRARLEPFLTRSGIMVAQAGASGAIVVTDTPDALDRIAAYLDHENRVLTRRIRLVFEEITLATQDTAQNGLDWDLIFSSARVAASASMGSGGLVEAGVATLRMMHGPMSGSEAMVAALSKVGRIVRHSRVPVMTLNRRPVTHAVRTTFSYIDRVDTTAYNDGAGMALPSVSVSQKEETVGSLLTLLPDAQDDGRILLSLAYDNTVAQPIKSVKFGDRANPLQLQQVTIEGNGTVQQLVLQPGQPMLISGFERRNQEAAQERVAPGLPLIFGGSDRLAREQLTTVIMITAQVEEGV